MNELKEIITDYLKAPITDYAIMISGPWGCGKSFFLHHDFIDLVKSVSVPKKKEGQKDHKYKPAFVSLYGVSSAEDFEYRVFCGINDWAEKGYIRVGSAIFAKGISFLGIEFSKKDTSSITFVGKDRVLVFDDLERISQEKIPVKEVLGLINSYAEHTHRKVIIVCNEIEFLENNSISEDFQKYKEKSVRFSYLFKPDDATAYDAMVTDIQERNYKDYLIENKDSILAVFRTGGNINLRTLRFFIDTFGKIYVVANKSKYSSRVVKNYMIAHMLYSKEYKRGVAIDELFLLDESQYRIDTLSLLNNHREEDTNENKKDYTSEFKDKYNTVLQDFINSKSLLNYISSGYVNKDTLLEEIRELETKYDKEQGTEEGMIYNKLNNTARLRDEEIQPLLDKMCGFIESDKYNLYDLLYIYTLFLKYNYWHIGGFRISEKIDNLVLSSMERQKDKHIYNPLFDFKTPIWDSSAESKFEFEKYNAIKSVASRINRDAKVANEATDCNRFISVAEKGDEKELMRYRIDENNRMSVNGMDWDRISHLILTAPNPIACELCECIIFLTPESALVPVSEQERIKERLIPVLETHLKSESGQLRDIYVTELVRHLKGITRTTQV